MKAGRKLEAATGTLHFYYSTFREHVEEEEGELVLSKGENRLPICRSAGIILSEV